MKPFQSKQNDTSPKPETLREKLLTAFFIVHCNLILILGYCTPVFAATNYGENIAKYVFDFLFWICLIAVVVVVLKCVIARNFVAAGITAVLGVVVAVFVKDPNAFVTMGEDIINIIKSGS